MENEVLTEIKELKSILSKIIDIDKEILDNGFNEETLKAAQKLYRKMSIERGEWVTDQEIGKYTKSANCTSGTFIRKEFQFANWIKRGHQRAKRA